MMTTALVLIICFSASTLGGVCGIGGGVVIKPLLDSIGIMYVSTVSFLSGLTVLAMACLNVLKNRRGGELDTARSVAAPRPHRAYAGASAPPSWASAGGP